MQINFTGHRLDVTEPLRDYATKKLDRIHRRFERIQHIDVIFDVEKLRQIAEAKVSFPGGEINATSENEDMYAAIDSLIDKLDRQMIKHKEKMHAHRD